MKKILYLTAILALPISCIQDKNDLVHEEVVADIRAFEIENQESCSLSYMDKAITVTMPPETDASRLKITRLEYTEGATLSPNWAVGDIIDLSSPVQLVLTTYDSYNWTISAIVLEKPEKPEEPEIPEGPDPEAELTRDGPQLYNMDFDQWSFYPGTDYIYVLYGDDADESQQAVWAFWGQTLPAYGLPTYSREEAFLAVEGEGKSALRLETMDVTGSLAAGLVFNGEAADFFPLTFDYKLGTPFLERPAALEGYACYRPKIIDHCQAPYDDVAGEMDKGHVIILLTDWDDLFTVVPPTTLVDFVGDPAIIGYGKFVFDQETEGYEHFQVNISYRSDRVPKYAAILISSSTYGDYFTGGAGSVLYVDELAFLYEAPPQ